MFNLIVALLIAALAAPGLVAQARTPLVSEALKCGKVGTAGSLANGMELQRHNLDTTRYPNALCNDGSNAIFYYRPYQGAVNRNRWVIQLQGGGSCGSANDCANRWCSVDTNFSSVGMSSNPAPKVGINGNGILERRADNPMGAFNHVLVKYCSSDKWSGTARDTIVDADDPVTGAPVTMRLHFLGSRILDAAIGTLRQAGGVQLNYTLGGTDQEMPNLDDAEVVILAGASGGAGGVNNNADRLGALLRRTNNSCRGQRTCGLLYRALHDSAYNPDPVNLDFSTTPFCVRFGYCTPEEVLTYDMENGEGTLWKSRIDESCGEWHRKNDPDREWLCADSQHILVNHITTPLFIRMGQTDELLSAGMLEAQYTVPGQGVMTLESYAALIRAQMTALSTVKEKGEEGGEMTVTPGGFSPTCPDHETLGDTSQTFNVRITAGGQTYRLFDVIQNWLEG
ncbi:MAG: hypothetical protein HY820_33295 [Acidobacteria bacterium]|nr:hypothetical protein [Acidobacteriota bacterium]